MSRSKPLLSVRHSFAASCAIVAIFGLTLVSAPSLRAQDKIAEQAGAVDSALTDFDFVVDVLRADYAGFSDKTRGDKAAEFERAVRDHRAAVAAHPASAASEIRALLGWFQDRHLGLSSSVMGTDMNDAEKAALKTQGPIIQISEDQARAAADATLGSPAGIWTTPDGVYRLALMPAADGAAGWTGIVLSTQSATWARGQVKLTLSKDGESTWRMADHSERVSPATVQPDIMTLPDAGIVLIRDYPEPGVEKDRLVPADEFFLRRLSPRTLWLRLPNFASESRETIEAILSENDALLRSTPNLVIDLRNNSGGNDSSYAKLMGYLYTRPIYAIGAEIRSSARNIAFYEALIDGGGLDAETRDYVVALVGKMKASDAAFVPQTDRDFIITTYPEVMPFPKRVAIVGTGAGSSGDQFVMDARFSRKVTLMGGPTAGVIDYSNVAEAPLPNASGYTLRWATSKSMRLPDEPIDNIGVLPDVSFGPEVTDPIGEAQRWLERQVD